jgi:hypothetical protein
LDQPGCLVRDQLLHAGGDALSAHMERVRPKENRGA